MTTRLLQSLYALFSRQTDLDVVPDDSTESGLQLSEWAEYVRVPELISGESNIDTH